MQTVATLERPPTFLKEHQSTSENFNVGLHAKFESLPAWQADTLGLVSWTWLQFFSFAELLGLVQVPF